MVAITVSTAALIIVLSVFNGFEGLVKNLYGDFYADIKITPKKGKFLTADDVLIKQIKTVEGVKALSFVAEEKAVLVNGDYQTIVFLKGVDDNYISVNKLPKYISEGAYNLGSIGAPALVSGSGIANAVGAFPGLPFSDLAV